MPIGHCLPKVIYVDAPAEMVIKVHCPLEDANVTVFSEQQWPAAAAADSHFQLCLGI